MIRASDTPFLPWRSALVATAAATGATYFYFLIYAEFALLKLAEPFGAAAGGLRDLMLGLGLGGVAGSVIAAWWFDLGRFRWQLAWAFRACALGAALALLSRSWPVLLLSAMLSGLALGGLTVILAAGMRAVIGLRRLGWVLGTGTGVAYAVCNLPWVFDAGERTQTILAFVAVVVASMVTRFLVPRDRSVPAEPDFRPVGLLRWSLIFLVLVWLDSAAFYVIQHENGLKAVSWQGSQHLLINAAIHLVVALMAGAWIDRGGRLLVTLIAFLLLALGCVLLDGTAKDWASFFYSAGVSLYSVLLVYYPTCSGRAWSAATIYALAGWVGSALGIGMAQDLHRVPSGFLIISGAVLAGVGLWRGLAQ